MKRIRCRLEILAIVLAVMCSFAMSKELLAQQADADTSQAGAEHAAADSERPQQIPENNASDFKAPFRLKDDIQSPSPNQNGRSVATLVFGLFAVLAAIFGLAWLSKRFNLSLPGASAEMKLLGALSVGAKEKLILVEVEGSKLLLGVTTQQINLLKNFDSSEAQVQQGEFSHKMLKLLNAEAGDDL